MKGVRLFLKLIGMVFSTMGALTSILFVFGKLPLQAKVFVLQQTGDLHIQPAPYMLAFIISLSAEYFAYQYPKNRKQLNLGKIIYALLIIAGIIGGGLITILIIYMINNGSIMSY